MSTRSRRSARSTPVTATKQTARALVASRRGITTSGDFRGLFSGLIADVIEGKVAPAVANAACNAGGKLLKVVELEYRYGTPNRNKTGRSLQLSPASA